VWSPRSAPGVSLEDVHGAGLEHPPEVRQIVTVFASGDLDRGRHPIPKQPKPFQVVGADGFLEPADIERLDPVGDVARSKAPMPVSDAASMA